jgi:hypothetical protein
VAGGAGQVVGVGAGSGVQGGGEGGEALAGPLRAEFGDVGDRLVRQPQAVRLAGPDVDGGQQDAGQGASPIVGDALPAPYRRRGERLRRV